MAGKDSVPRPPEQNSDDRKVGNDVGERLRALRKWHGWSQRQLAQRADVTHATISLIEQGRVSPSVGSLKKVLDGIPMSLAEFFNLKFDTSPQVFFRADELPEAGCGNVECRLLGAPEASQGLSIRYTVYPPGECSGPELQSGDGEEGGIIVSGHLEVTVGGEVSLLGPGDAYFFSSRRPHRFRNPGEVDCVLVSASAPVTV
ncbi:XRE family transcriptional regulator [Microbulbifer flavimaris]|uniref:XRE family transcriptional regulator n=1 Tax=Microbulbifer flavimaris TaxID=1781068 RepID=A0ABX4HX40_9GAMM|nr:MULTISPECIES: cupin domain-containing protein [Microbulbifer]KUJ80226.1 hypothetical protein AVO43_14505 [Microbulbifer sp. ZGT114]PCO04292.1 XRE family transcriptional regulator [Microbulbifer flavimaris]